MSLVPGVNPAVPVGTEIVFGCPSTQVFAHDWYARPSVIMTCQDNGEFDVPELWSVCVERNNFQSISKRLDSNYLVNVSATTSTTPCPQTGCPSKYQV